MNGVVRRRKSFGRRPTRSQTRDPRMGSCDAAKALAEGQRVAGSARAMKSAPGGDQFWVAAALSTSWCTSESASSYSIAKPEELCRTTRPTNSTGLAGAIGSTGSLKT